MKRPLTTNFAAPPPSAPEPEHASQPTWRELAPIVSALLATFEIMETSPTKGPALKAHRSTIRRQGEAAAAIGGAEAVQEVLRQLAQADASRAERRAQLVREAWAELPGAAAM